MSVISFFKQLFVKVGFSAPLSFDQQVWGAKSVMDLVEHGSQFLLAKGTNGQDCYTAWLGARTKISEALVINNVGRATGPFPDDSLTKDCVPWTYPPKLNCAQAVAALVKSGVTETWMTCTLKKTTAQKNPCYTFTFSAHAPVTVDANTGKIV